MRCTRFALATAVALATCTIGLAGAAEASSLDIGDDPINCVEDGGYITFGVEITTDDASDRFLIELGGYELETDVPAGVYQVANAGPFADGVVSMYIKSYPDGVQLFGWQFPVACEGPLVEVATQCDDDTRFLNIAFWSTFDDTADIYVDGVIVSEDVEADDTNGYLGHGSYPAGDHLVEIDWLEDKSDEPYYSETVTFGVCPEADSGAGIPETGSNTAPMLMVAAGLMVCGAALLGTRRAHRV